MVKKYCKGCVLRDELIINLEKILSENIKYSLDLSRSLDRLGEGLLQLRKKLRGG